MEVVMNPALVIYEISSVQFSHKISIKMLVISQGSLG